MELKPGSRWRSAACTAEVVVVRPPRMLVALECGGRPMTLVGTDPAPAKLVSGHARGTVIGKRYFDEDSGLEVLGTKAGQGSLSIDGRSMTLKEAKPLPSSD